MRGSVNKYRFNISDCRAGATSNEGFSDHYKAVLLHNKHQMFLEHKELCKANFELEFAKKFPS